MLRINFVAVAATCYKYGSLCVCAEKATYRPRDRSVFNQRCEMRRAAHLSSRGRVSSLRPLVAVASLAARCSRNVRISCTLMPYHHKAPQHERARHATYIVGGERRTEKAQAALGDGRWSAAPRGTTDCCALRRRRDTGAPSSAARTRAPTRPSRPAPALLPSHHYLLRYYQ